MTDNETVLVAGATGFLGGRVVDELLNRGKKVRALARPGSDATKLESQGVRISRGDMLDPASLDRAMEGADAVITTAAGYTRRYKNATEIDTTGNANLAAAAHRAGTRRFVLTSILTTDLATDVPHFWNKKLAEDRLEKLGVPFVALRPGAFLDQVAATDGDPFAKGRLSWLGDPAIPMTFVLTTDVARNLVDAVDAEGVDGQRIDIGWDRPVSMNDIAEIAGRQLRQRIRVRAVPLGVVHTARTLLGPFAPTVKDLSAMIDWFQTGRFVADTTRQAEVFGVPTAEDALARFEESLGHGPR